MSLLDSCESTSDDLRPAIDASLLEVRWLVTTSGTALHCERPHSSLLVKLIRVLQVEHAVLSRQKYLIVFTLDEPAFLLRLIGKMVQYDSTENHVRASEVPVPVQIEHSSAGLRLGTTLRLPAHLSLGTSL